MSKHDTVKKKKKTSQKITFLQKQNLNIFSRDKKKKETHRVHKLEKKKKQKNLTINKTCVCDPHSLNISFLNLGHEGEEEKKKERERDRNRETTKYFGHSRYNWHSTN